MRPAKTATLVTTRTTSIIAVISILISPSLYSEEFESLMTYEAWADRMTVKYCPKDGSSWHDHALLPKISNDPFVQQSIALCDAYQLSRHNLQNSLVGKELYGFYVFVEKQSSGDERLFQKLPVGPFFSQTTCTTHNKNITEAGVGSLPCSVIQGD